MRALEAFPGASCPLIPLVLLAAFQSAQWALAQEHAAGTIAMAPSSDLSSAFPPAEWTRIGRSVDIGLAWLATQQADDGSFPTNPVGQPAVTSMAVMAFLSRGHLPGHGRYGKQLDRAIDYVLAQQSRRGYFSLLPIAPSVGHLKPPQTLLYNHSISGLMLGEVYGMTSGDRSQHIEKAISEALLFSRSVQSRQKQHPDEAGGWRYAFPESPTANSDISVTGWALMFYRSARNAEFEVPKQYFDEGLDFIARCYVSELDQRTEGVFRYRPLTVQSEARPTLANTGSAMLALLLGGQHESEMVAAGVEWYLSRAYPSPAQGAHFYLASYYSSQAMAQVGGATWDHVYPQIVDQLLKEQAADGSWPAGRANEVSFGSTYATSLAVLALTPPYQLLPIYQR
ncbi:MAG: hypothetical protein AB7O38_11940 [Pirellulaceae bacterium]